MSDILKCGRSDYWIGENTVILTLKRNKELTTKSWGGGDEQTFDVLQIGSVVQCSARGIGGYKARGPLRTGRQKQVSAAAG